MSTSKPDAKIIQSSAHHAWSVTWSQVGNVSFLWTITNFSFLQNESYLVSSAFSDGISPEKRWTLRLYPRGEHNDDSDFISLVLCLDPTEKKPATAKFKVSLLNADQHVIHSRRETKAPKVSPGQGFGFRRFIRRRSVLDDSHEYLVSDRLTVLCELNVLSQITEHCSPRDPQIQEFPSGELSELIGNLDAPYSTQSTPQRPTAPTEEAFHDIDRRIRAHFNERGVSTTTAALPPCAWPSERDSISFTKAQEYQDFLMRKRIQALDLRANESVEDRLKRVSMGIRLEDSLIDPSSHVDVVKPSTSQRPRVWMGEYDMNRNIRGEESREQRSKIVSLESFESQQRRTMDKIVLSAVRDTGENEGNTSTARNELSDTVKSEKNGSRIEKSVSPTPLQGRKHQASRSRNATAMNKSCGWNPKGTTQFRVNPDNNQGHLSSSFHEEPLCSRMPYERLLPADLRHLGGDAKNTIQPSSGNLTKM